MAQLSGAVPALPALPDRFLVPAGGWRRVNRLAIEHVEAGPIATVVVTRRRPNPVKIGINFALAWSGEAGVFADVGRRADLLDAQDQPVLRSTSERHGRRTVFAADTGAPLAGFSRSRRGCIIRSHDGLEWTSYDRQIDLAQGRPGAHAVWSDEQGPVMYGWRPGDDGEITVAVERRTGSSARLLAWGIVLDWAGFGC